MLPAQAESRDAVRLGDPWKSLSSSRVNLDEHLTHQEVKDGHVHDVQQSSASVIRRRLLHLITVIWVHLPPENTPKHTLVVNGIALKSGGVLTDS